MTLLDAALDLHQHGCSVVPAATDGTKRPAVAWKNGQERRAGAAQLDDWFGNKIHRVTPLYDGLGVITGAISGNLEMLEVEGRASHLVGELAKLMADNGFADLWTRLCSGYLEQSPSGGLHWLYRVDGPARPNTKLARRPNADNPQLVDVLIETRGEGGFTITAPSAGRTHPTGLPWRLLAGTPGTIPTLTVDERDAVHAIANMLDQMPAVDLPEQIVTGNVTSDGLRPGDDYNARADWADIIGSQGWTRTKHFGGTCYGWTRPGKNPRDGISATTGRNDGDNLYVFTSSTEFDTEKAYSKFAAYTLLEHNGDYAAAAGQLRKDGYGEPPPEQARPLLSLVVEPVSTVEAAPPTPAPTTYSLTDDGNALRLVDAHSAELRYCPEAGSWLRWTGRKWEWDTGGHVHEFARDIARQLARSSKTQTLHRKKSLSNNGLKAMVNVARTDVRIIVSPTQLDARPYELNTPGGVVDLRTGVLRDPDPAALHTRSTPIAPDFDTPAPRWEKFLADTFAGQPEMTTYVQRLLGLSMIGEHLEQILPFQWGSGANGKSTLMDVTQGIVGTGQEGYSIPAPTELLLASTQRGHPTELARLSGARLVVASELEDGERFAESRVKMLTGGDTIAARFMGKDFFSFVPTHTIWMHANDKPAVRTGGPAFWRRLRLLPFVHVVPREERINGLDKLLIAQEGPAILAWLIRGSVDYLAHGLAEPDSVRVATSAYERDQDTVARFVEECCELGPQSAQHLTVRVAEVRAAYETWCRGEGETPVSAKALTTALSGRFDVVPVRSKSARFYAGMRLTDVSPETTESDPDEQIGWWQR